MDVRDTEIAEMKIAMMVMHRTFPMHVAAVRPESCRRARCAAPTPVACSWLTATATTLLAAVWTSAAAAPTVADALVLQPKAKNVEFDRLTPDQAQKATIAQEKIDGTSALVVRGPGGEMLRAFADTDGNRVVDRWSYYKDGIEVYRDIDSDNDTKVDQARWLNSAGGRWAVDTKGDGVLDAWKSLSAEEATAEIVAAIRDQDAAGFLRLLPTKADLEAAGFEGPRLEDVLARVGRAAKQFAQLAAGQKQIVPGTRWASMLTPQPPGVIPAGVAGVASDISAYDNVVALVESPGAGGGQVFVGSLVKCGAVWRPVDLPQLMGEAGDMADLPGFFTPQAVATAGAGAIQDDRLKPLMAKLQEIEGQMTAADDRTRPALAGQQIQLLEQVVSMAAPADKTFWTQQFVETLAAYVQEGLLPEGLEKLQALEESAADDPAVAAFIAFRIAQARYSSAMQQSGVDGEKVQNQWFDDLRQFVEKYPAAPEAAEAMLQLGFRDEFEGREKEAIEQYREITAAFAGTPQARKASGAIRRLESVGKPLSLSGPTLDGRSLAVDSLRGVPLLVHFWSTDCEPCKVDLAQIRELQATWGPKRLAVVGVALDGDKGRLQAFLKGKPLPWPQLYEPGGLDSRLAEELGVLALPTMLLVDAQGNVVDRNVSITGLERKIEGLIEKK
jgi:thiol-disulfide isomerase/thioredoxin